MLIYLIINEIHAIIALFLSPGEIYFRHTPSPHRHQLTDDPEAAEIILLAGDLETPAQAQANPLLQEYPEKTMAYSEMDDFVLYVPGVYCSAATERGIKLRRAQSNIYFSRYGSSMNPEVRHRPGEAKQLLFCFRGRKDCRVRRNIIEYPYNRPDIELLETTGYMHWNSGIVGTRQSQKDYADALASSHFALCPRGMGFGSIRLFEVMEMGVAPVLLADRYALPPGPDWESFLLKVPEREFARLPEILERHVPESVERGRQARLAWEQFFAPELVFNRVVDQLIEIRRQTVVPERLFRQVWPLLKLRKEARATVSQAVRSGVGMLRGSGANSREGGKR